MADEIQWKIRDFDPEKDKRGVLKLWETTCLEEGTVPFHSPEILDAILAQTINAHGRSWRVAEAGDGDVWLLAGLLEVAFLGTVRTRIGLVVHPRFRNLGIGKALLAEAPQDKRLLAVSESTDAIAAHLLSSRGFAERRRDLRMRKPVEEVRQMPLPDGIEVQEDPQRDPDRALSTIERCFDDDTELDFRLWEARLNRPGTRVIYLVADEQDEGIAVVAPFDQATRKERDGNGHPKIAELQRIGITPAFRKRKLSRHLVRAALEVLEEWEGYEAVEVVVEARRAAAQALYELEGFSVRSEDIHWTRRES
jgi:ribosomal protein S18 acetylase RimI-like enzyme